MKDRCIMNFNELNIPKEIVQAIEDMGFTEMTEIQKKSIPLLLQGHDIIGRSNTGTGKTVAFGIPAVVNISPNDCESVKTLILCPTRELAVQCCDEIKKIAKYTKWIKPCAIFGGASMERQITQLKYGANVVIGTPGRVIDHINRKTLKLGEVTSIILDEADEMLNMGFREDIETILKSIPQDRQTILFSATMPNSILEITNQFQKEPILVKTETSGHSVETIEQYWFNVPMGRKTDALIMVLYAYSPKSAMIFCNTKKTVDELTESLISKGFNAIGLHGDMKQIQRIQVMNNFKKGRSSILIATDVAARGIDVDDIEVVFNYDIPQDIEYYTHRIGRTGRAGKSGRAYTLVTGRKQVYTLKSIGKSIGADIKELQLPNRKTVISNKCDAILNDIVSSIKYDYSESTKSVYGRLVESGLTDEQVAMALLEERVSNELSRLPEFDIPQPLKNRRNLDGSDVKTVKIDISVGRNQKIAPNFILGALVEATGLSGKNFGKIDIYDSHTTVEVPKDSQELVLSSMKGEKINGNKVVVRLYDGKKKLYTDYDRRLNDKNRKHKDFFSLDRPSRNKRTERFNSRNRRGKSYNKG